MKAFLILLLAVVGLSGCGTIATTGETVLAQTPMTMVETTTTAQPTTTVTTDWGELHDWASTMSEQAFELADLLDMTGQAATVADFDGAKYGAGLIIDKCNAIQAHLRAVPAGMEVIASTYSEGIGCFKVGCRLLITGIDNMDPDVIDQATAKVIEGSDLVQQATTLMQVWIDAK